jgi:hypothetical protein
MNVSNWASNFYGFASSDGSPIYEIGIDYSTNFGAGNPGIADLIFNPSLMGDANGDGKCDINDLTIVLANYGKTGVWNTGDFNGNGTVDINDLTIVLANYGQSAGTGALSSVPEPPAFVLAAITIALLLAWLRHFRMRA